MKKLIYFLKITVFFCLLIVFNTGEVFAQKYDIDWVNVVGSENGEEIQGMAIKDDFVYSIGLFTDTVDFDPGANIINLIGQSAGSLFITKTHSSGQLAWANKLDINSGISTGPYRFVSMSTDDLSNIYISGVFKGTVDFDPGPATVNLSASSPGTDDLFILKLDSAGNFLWAKSIASTAASFMGNYTKILSNGENIYLSGFIYSFDPSGTVDFDPGPAVVNRTVGSLQTSYVLKLDKDGNFKWARTYNGDDISIARSLSVDSSGNVLIIGDYQGTVNFDPGVTDYSITSNPGGDHDVYILKLDSTGNFVWVRSIGGEAEDNGFDLATDQGNNVYCTGLFGHSGTTIGTADFDPGAGATILNTNGQHDAYILKLNSGGNFVWVKQLGGNLRDAGTNIATDHSGKLYVSLTLGLTGNVDFNPNSGVYNISSPIMGGEHPGICILDTAGSFVWGGITASPTNSSLSSYNKTCIGYDTLGNIYLAGRYANPSSTSNPSILDFDPGPNTITVNHAGDNDIFLVKLTPCTIKDTLLVQACDSFYFRGHLIYMGGIHADTTHIPGTCDSFFVLNLLLGQTPDTSIVRTGNTLTSPTSNATYQWIDCDDNTPIPGATGTSFTPVQDGNYKLAITGFDGCSDTSFCYSFVMNSILELGTNNTLQIFPNPSTGELTIRSQEQLKDGMVSLFNLQGQILMHQQNLKGNDQHLDISLLAAGVYILEVKSGEQIVKVKLIKE